MMAALSANQKFITGLFTATENGTPIEMIAWAESLRTGVFKMENGSLDDAPVLPRTYRFLLNISGFEAVQILAATGDIFSKGLEGLDHRTFPFTVTRLAIDTFEIGIPQLENWDNVVRLRKSLRVTQSKPLIFFLIVTNGTVTRAYPFFIDRQ